MEGYVDICPSRDDAQRHIFKRTVEVDEQEQDIYECVDCGKQVVLQRAVLHPATALDKIETSRRF